MKTAANARRTREDAVHSAVYLRRFANTRRVGCSKRRLEPRKPQAAGPALPSRFSLAFRHIDP